MSGEYVEIPWGREKEVYTTTFGGREMFLGQRGMTPDGRTFRWAFSGGAIGAGLTVCTAPIITNEDEDLVVAANSVGDPTITVTTGGAVAENLYQFGYVYANITPGAGHLYVIKSHLATTTSASLVLNLFEKVRVAMTGTTRCGLVKNRFRDVIVTATDSNVGVILGVTCAVITDNDYFWIQDTGPSAVLHEDTQAILGDAVELGVDVAGAVQLHDTSGVFDRMSLGVESHVGTTAGQHGIIELHMG